MIQLTKKDMKNVIKMFKKEKNYGKMNKAELLEYMKYLINHGEVKKDFLEHFDELHGGGFFDFFRSPKKEYNNTSTNTLREYGNDKILSITLNRSPIMSILNSALNVLSFGAWKRALKKQSIDKLFHLSMIVKVQHGSTQKMITVEKNEVINISPKTTIKENAEIEEVPLHGKNITLNTLMSKARENKSADDYFLYDGFKRNCQDFLLNIVEANGLLTPDIRSWIKQDVAELAKDVPEMLPKVMNTVTDLGARFNQAIGGDDAVIICKKCGLRKPRKMKKT